MAEGGVTPLFLLAVFVAAFGSAFQYGYNVGVVNAPQSSIQRWMGGILMLDEESSDDESKIESQTTFLFALVVSVFCLGGMLGGLLVHVWVLLFGLKNGIVLNNILVFIAAFLMGFSRQMESYYMLIAGRFVIGVVAGLAAGLTPMYLTEISPVALRGTIGSVFQLFLTISILIAQVVGLDFLLGNDRMWQYLFYLVAIVGVFQIIILPFCANSPRYLFAKGKEEMSRKALMWLRGSEDVTMELDQIKKEVMAEQSAGSVSLAHLFSRKELRKPLAIACILMIGQQLSGINAIIYYSTYTFQDAGLSVQSAQYGTLCIGFVNVIMTIISTAIVDKAGRRPLLLISFGAMFVDTALFFGSYVLAQKGNVVASYCCVILLMLYIIFFATGLGSIPWFMVSELFPQNARSTAVSIVIVVHWVSNFLVGLLFPLVQREIGPYVFLIFCVIQVILFVYVANVVPETKNRTIDEIAADFKK